MANKIFRQAQDELNSLTTSQLERYGEELSGKLAIIIFDKQYNIVETQFQPGVITFTSVDYHENLRIFQERDRHIGDKSIMFDVRHKQPPYNYESWERIDLAFEGDFIMYYDEYAKVIEITEQKITLLTTETDTEIVLIKPFSTNKLSDFLVVLNRNLIREIKNTESEPEPVPSSEPRESGKHLIEIIDTGAREYFERNEFCVVGDKVKTSYGDGEITEFDTENKTVFLKRENGMNFHCFANEVVELITDQDQDDQDQDDQDDQDDERVICKSVTFYGELIEQIGDTYAAYPNRVMFFEYSNGEIYNGLLALYNASKWDNNERIFENYEKWMSDLDDKLLKFMILKVKNNPEYYEPDGYQRFYYDKVAYTIKLAEETNVVYGKKDDDEFYIYSTRENNYSIYTKTFSNKDKRYDFVIEGNRIKFVKEKYNSMVAEMIFGAMFDNADINFSLQLEGYAENLLKKMEIFINLVEP